MIAILNSELRMRGIVNRVIEANYKETLAGEKEINFTAIIDDKILGLVNDNTIFALNDDYFDTSFLLYSLEEGLYTIEVEAEHVSYRLNKEQYHIGKFVAAGTPTEVLNMILEGTEFSVGTVEFSEPMIFTHIQKTSRRKILIDFVNQLGGDILFDKFKVNILSHRGSSAVKSVLPDRDIQKISKTVDKYSLDENSNPTITYICEPVANPKKTYELGDEILVANKLLNITQPFRIISMSVNPYDQSTLKLTFGKQAKGLDKSIRDLESATSEKSGVGAKSAGEHAEIFNDYERNVAGGIYSHASGRNSKAIGDHSIASGHDATATGTGSVAIGSAYSKTWEPNVASSPGPVASGNYAIALGVNTKSEGVSSVAIGGEASDNINRATVASGDYSVAIGGTQAKATGYRSVAIGGYNPTASGDYSTAIGSANRAMGPQSVAIGYGNKCRNNDSYAVGYDNDNNSYFGFVAGYNNIINGGSTNMALGYNCKSLNGSAMACFMAGYRNEINSGGVGNTAVGYKNEITGGMSSLVSGYGNVISQQHSAILGGMNNNIHSQSSGILGGSDNEITGNSSYKSIIGGYKNKVNRHASSIIGGDNNTNKGIASAIISGRDNEISSFMSDGSSPQELSAYDSSIIGGCDNKFIEATNQYGSPRTNNTSSIIGGSGNRVGVKSGEGSVILGGINNKIGGSYNTVTGNNSISYSDNQFVMGKFNIQDDESQYALIVGGGTSDERKNILTLDWDGNLDISGDITGSVNGKSPYVSEDDTWMVYDDETKEWIDSGIIARGTDGKSAYESALDNGFEGTVEEWLDSLKGSNGEDGKTAYEVAIQNGFVGDENDWLESLKGPKGDIGSSGKTAYEVAVQNGFTGTETEWLESLKGPKGDKGDDGAGTVVVDNLTSTSTTSALSANQGRLLDVNKVDKVTGKSLSTNDLTNLLKSNYDTAHANSHTHTNKTVLDATTASYTTTLNAKLAGIAAGAQVNQNAFARVAVGSTTLVADSVSDTLNIVGGSNVTVTGTASSDTMTISATDTTYSNATTLTAGLMSATDKSVVDDWNTKKSRFLNGTNTNAVRLNTSSNSANGSHSVAGGYDTRASGNYSTAFGFGCSAALYGFAVGNACKAQTNTGAVAMGDQNIASGRGACAVGSSTTASGSQSFTANNYTSATASYSSAFGNRTTAGVTGGFAIGSYSNANGLYAFAAGHRTEAWQYQTVLGKFNATAYGPTITSSTSGNPLVIGKGTSTSARANCFRIETNGAVYATGNFNSSGADYAEYFEWLDGNPEDEDRRGLFVTLDGEKVCIANAGDDYILGVISANASVIGDSHEDQWNGMYMCDVYGSPILEWVEEPAVIDDDGNVIQESYMTQTQKLNPDYDHTKSYTPRSQRKEWAVVGLMGKLIVRDDGTCQVNSYCSVSDGGIATSSDTGYRVLSRIDGTHIKILMK